MSERITDSIPSCGCSSSSCSSKKNHHHNHDHHDHHDHHHHHDHDHDAHHHDDHSHGHDHNHDGQFSKKDIIEFVIALGLFLLGLLLKVDKPITIALFVSAYLVVGREIIVNAFRGIFTGRLLDENFLMTIASITAFIIGEYPEAVAVMLFYRVGELFEGLAVNKSKNSIEQLLNIKPEIANVKVGNTYKKVEPEKVNVNDIIMVKPGEKIPLDGVVIEGVSTVDTSVITGESLPRDIEVETEVYSGSINLTGVILVKVIKEFSESTVAKILNLVKESNAQKANTEKFISKFARYYTPIVVGIAVFMAIVPPIIVGDFAKWIYTAAIFLVVSCPCALVISIPLGYFGGIGGASTNGILVKGGNYLEALRNVTSVVVDKTGTLTKGVFKVSEIILTDNNVDREKVIQVASHIEHFSNHPIAVSIVNEYGKEIDETKVANIVEVAGKGIKAVFDGEQVVIGNKKLMEEENIIINNEANNIGTKVYVAINNILVGIIIIADELKVDTISAIEKLKEYGVKEVVMLTGDHEEVAKEIASKTGITKYYSELLPHDKVSKLVQIMETKDKNEKVIFVGDGINDAPVLARADVGIAMGAVGSDAAIEAADVVLMTDELSSIPRAIKIARHTNKIVWENIIFALGIKVIIMLLATIGFANMWMAIFADVGVAVIAILNSIRALKVKRL